MKKITFNSISLFGVIALTVGFLLLRGGVTYAADRKTPIQGEAFTLTEKDKDFVTSDQKSTGTTNICD